MKYKISTDDAPKAEGLLSQGIVSNSFVFISGQIHSKPDGTIVNGSTEEKTHQIMQNLEAILKAAGSDFSKVVKATLYVTDMSLGVKVNEVYKTYIKEEPLPAREMVRVEELPLGANIEISMVATVD